MTNRCETLRALIACLRACDGKNYTHPAAKKLLEKASSLLNQIPKLTYSDFNEIRKVITDATMKNGYLKYGDWERADLARYRTPVSCYITLKQGRNPVFMKDTWSTIPYYTRY